MNNRLNEIETLKQTNQVIQKEMTKWNQNCIALEKQKLSLELKEESNRKEIEALKNNEKLLIVSLFISNRYFWLKI